VDLWTEPVVRWETGFDSRALHAELLERGELVATWPPAPFEDTATDCFKVGQDFWIWQPGVGGITFRVDHPEFVAFPAEDVAPSWFEYLITRNWMPAVYQVWGRQVLHASGVAWEGREDVVAFAGASGAGKSTIAYGLGRRIGWRLVSDDTLAFSCDGRRVSLYPLRNEARLRPATAAYYGKSGEPPQTVEWPKGRLALKRVYFLSGSADLDQPARISLLRAGESYPLLLEQAHAFTLAIPKHNQQLMRDYLALAAATPIFRLEYRRSFDAVEDILDAVERHWLSDRPAAANA